MSALNINHSFAKRGIDFANLAGDLALYLCFNVFLKDKRPKFLINAARTLTLMLGIKPELPVLECCSSVSSRRCY